MPRKTNRVSGEEKGNNPDTISGGFIQDQHGGQPSVENPRPDELSHPVLDVDNHPRPWTKLPRNRKTKLALMGMGKDYLDKGDPRYARAVRLANSYRKARAKELAAIHGYVSSGANALLGTASLALAASRFLYEKAAENGDADIMRSAARIADSARQAELAAWEMSAREGLVKRRLDANREAMPWLVTQDGKEKAKPGRKTNHERYNTIAALPGAPSMTTEEALLQVDVARGEEKKEETG